MEEEVELFDLSQEEFEQQVRLWAMPPYPAAPPTVSLLMLRNAVTTLARLIYALGQRVKKLEREE